MRTQSEIWLAKYAITDPSKTYNPTPLESKKVVEAGHHFALFSDKSRTAYPLKQYVRRNTTVK